ncbi:hypothetical protein AB2B38_000915 [Balneola sp. MJW-20]|uniref:hypothetical protein n=1 Tax=Gracilimonas aurantiaca TaxID=3234185 RepID=UPI0034674060
MIRPMFGFRPKPKKFDYQFRYYDPEKDEREKRKKRIKFETHTRRRPAQFTRVLFFVVLLALVVYIISL